MTARYTELSSYLKRKSRESARAKPPDLLEGENVALAMTVAVGVSVSLAIAFSIVFLAAAGGQ